MSGLRAQSACIALMLAALAPLLAGCNEPTATAAPAAPEADVSVVVVQPRARAQVRELPGRIAPTRVAEVRPRVSGIIVERLFNQGSEVKAGDPLYRIDPRPFEVEVQSTEAALARAKAVLEQATSHANRVATLYREKAAPEAKNEEAVATLRQAEADVAARKADVARARLNLDYATIRAPIDGIVGAAYVSEGALVVQNESTSLATIQQLDPIYADFTQSVNEMQPAAPRARHRRARSHRARRGEGAARARRRRTLSAARQAAVLRGQGRRPYRAGDAARRIPQSEARAAAGHVCPRADRAGHRQRCHRGAAAGDPAQQRRRQRGVRRQGRRPRHHPAGARPARCRTACGSSPTA